jgi:hypothetical protein
MTVYDREKPVIVEQLATVETPVFNGPDMMKVFVPFAWFIWGVFGSLH